MTSQIGVPELLILCCIPLSILVALVAVVVGVVLMTRKKGTAPAAGTAQPTPLMILQERYARGEITAEQYEQMKRDLEK